MEKRQIINIINFIRGFDPRTEDDLTLPVKKQIDLLIRHGLKGTFLLQYDALINPAFSGMLKELAPAQFELGVWLEMVEPLNRRAGVPWRGRYAWDWQARYGFSVGYTLTERERLIDGLFTGFKEVFGYYPRVLGSWAFDAHTLRYASETYGLDAACNCKEQWGTDGYTIWGGPYGQGYYPGRENVLCPAGSREKQIDVPVFRMLGADPVLQYDCGLDVSALRPTGCQGVISLEPVYAGSGGGGGEPAWVDWYLREIFSGRCLSFGYAQAGQENSFGWPAMERGLTYQFDRFRQMQAAGEIQVETLGETGRWFKSRFPATPPAVIAAVDDWKGEGRKSVWYTCKNYRVNLYAEDGRFWIRDLYCFREDYRERYFDKICDSDKLTFDNLPVADGTRFSGGGVRGGLYPVPDAELPDGGMSFEEMRYAESDGAALVTFTGTPCGDVAFTLSESGIRIQADREAGLRFVNRFAPDADGLPQIRRLGPAALELTYEGFAYILTLDKGFVDDSLALTAHKGELAIRLDGAAEGETAGRLADAKDAPPDASIGRPD